MEVDSSGSVSEFGGGAFLGAFLGSGGSGFFMVILFYYDFLCCLCLI